MKYFSKKIFTMRQVVGLLTVVFLGITVIAYAAVTIPNNFNNGDTISSGQVNDNFKAIADEINRRLLPSVQLSDGSNGWDPDGFKTSFIISDANVTALSVVLISVRSSAYTVCGVDFVVNGDFEVNCTVAPANGGILNYVVINP